MWFSEYIYWLTKSDSILNPVTLYRCQIDLVTFQSMMTSLVPANNSQKGVVILSLHKRNLKQDSLMQ